MAFNCCEFVTEGPAGASFTGSGLERKHVLSTGGGARERELKESGGHGGPNHQWMHLFICVFRVSFPVVWIRGMISGSYVSLVTKIH